MVKGAEVVCQIWYRGRPGLVNLRCIDDDGIRDVKEISEYKETHYVQWIATFGLLLIIGLLLYNYYLNPMLVRSEQLTQQNIDLQELVDSNSAEIEQLKMTQESEEKAKDASAVLLEILDPEVKSFSYIVKIDSTV